MHVWTHTYTNTHTHTDVPSSGGVRSGDKATRGRGRRTTALTVPARGETESEKGVFLQVTLPFHYFTPSLSLSHTHTDVPSSGGVRSGDKATRGRGGGRGRRTTALTVPARGETESENGVFLPPGHLWMPPISLFYSLPFSHAHEHACMCAHTRTQTHTHTQMSHRLVVFVLETRQPEVGVGEPLLLQFQQEGKLRVRMVCSSRSPSHFTISLPLSLSHTHTQMSHHQVVFVLETRQPEAEVEVAVGEPLLLQFQQEGKLRVRMVCSSL